ncbi:MAG: hypothetical protein RR553_09180 [Akkermansia sp.]
MNEITQLAEFLDDQKWRLNHLYWIEDKEGRIQRFRMNYAQEHLHDNLHFRNDVLKARQLGISTYTALLMLDMSLFTPNFNSGIIDKTLPDAQQKLGKIMFAYAMLDYLPDNPTQEDVSLSLLGVEIKKWRDVDSKSQTLVRWSNGSNVRVGTSLRGGTIQLLHISELGHVSIHNPQRAKEIVTGSINSVSKEGVIIKESTHEGGRFGHNYELTSKALDMVGRELTPLDWKFFFFPWYKNSEYWLDPETVVIPEYLERYFASLEKAGIELDSGQKAWYCTMERTMGLDMWQEYPSTPNEAFEKRTSGSIYGASIDKLREQGRTNCRFEIDLIYPLYVSMDIGMSDAMSMWVFQPFKTEHRVLNHFQANNKELGFYVQILKQWEKRYCPITTIFLPHDGSKRDWEKNTFAQKLRDAGFNVVVLPRIIDVWKGINATYEVLRDCVFHEECNNPIEIDGKKYMSGMNALINYRTIPAGTNGSIRDEPLHDACSNPADAFRYYAEAVSRELVNTGVFTPKKRTTITGLGIARSGGFRRSNDDW